MRLCRLFGVTRAGFYASQTRPECQHEREDRTLRREVRAIFMGSRGAYGSPRIYKALRARGFAVSHRRVERLMREEGLRARVVRVYRRTTGTRRWFAQHPNRVAQRRATRCDQIWVSDLTYVRGADRWCSPSYSTSTPDVSWPGAAARAMQCSPARWSTPRCDGDIRRVRSSFTPTAAASFSARRWPVCLEQRASAKA
ncbi:MAG: IS3 family transposase [Vicinamibacterales bacterium]